MRSRNSNSYLAVFSAVLMLSAMAAASGAPWPEAHSGAYLGVQVTAVTTERASALKLPASSGAIIAYVDRDGPACHAGLLENDVVVAFDGAKVDGPEQLQNLIHVTPAQKTVTMTIVRNGLRKDVKVTLGSWNVMSHVHTANASNLASPPPPRAYPPDLELPSFTLLSARHGLVVESLTPQLSDFFGVAHGRGVLVRSVENGSPASAAGIKAGDIIVKVNNEEVHDMSDWQRGMHAPGKLAVVVWRERKEQTLVINVPGPDDTSRLFPSQQLDFDTQAQMVRQETELLKPVIEAQQAELAQVEPSQQDIEKMQREIQKQMKAEQKEMAKVSRELSKSNKKQMEQLRAEIQKSVPSQQQMDEMKRQVQESMPSQKDIDEMTRKIQAAIPNQDELNKMQQQIQSSMPSQQQLDQMRRQIEDQMKNLTPQMQQEMEQLKKQMEQQKLDLNQMMQEFQRQEY
jgi:serine protease Do